MELVLVCRSKDRLFLASFVLGNGFVFLTTRFFVELEEIVLFVNAGAMSSMELDQGIKILADKFFEGGDTFQTEEFITEGGDCSFIYTSARLGDFCYRIENLLPGDYYIDLHFVEIININGPKGMRVFDVFLQDEKVSELVIDSFFTVL